VGERHPRGEHLGGHLPFAADITRWIAWDRATTIAISVENKPLPDRVPAGPSPAGGLFAGLTGGYPATTYDFFPYTGLHRPVLLFSVPETHIEDVTVRTTLEGADGRVDVRVLATSGYSGRGRARLGTIEAPLRFQNGTAEVSLRVHEARPWSPRDPHLYSLSVSLDDGRRASDSYTLDVGIRTVEVRGDRLLLNGQEITLTGFGRHEDFPSTDAA
jgi:beta-glucuronidase